MADARQGSLRYLLQQAELLRKPNRCFPFNPKWKHHRGRWRDAALAAYAIRMRDTGQAILDWLEKKS